MEKQNQEYDHREKERNGCLTAWIVVAFVLNSTLALITLLFSSILSKKSGVSHELIIGEGILTICLVIFIYQIYKWKKAGFYGIVLLAFVLFFINYNTMGFSLRTIAGLFSVVFLYGLLQLKAKGVSGWDNLE